MVGFFKKSTKKFSMVRRSSSQDSTDDETVPTHIKFNGYKQTKFHGGKSIVSDISITSSGEVDDGDRDIVTDNNRHTWVAKQAFVKYDMFVECPVSSITVSRYDHFPLRVEDEMCLIKVEATTVTRLDCIIREGNWNKPVSLPAIPGIDFVGEVVGCGQGAYQKGFQVGDRVASFIRVGGNTRYLTSPVSDLVKVPVGIDSADAVCMIMPYMVAFQCLVHGKEGFERYLSRSLEGKKVLVSGGESLVGQATIQLARLMGASVVHAIVPNKAISFVKFLGAEPIVAGKDSLPEHLVGDVDVVVDCNESYLARYDGALNATGTIVRIANVTKSNQGVSLASLVEAIKLMTSPVEVYSYLDQWDNHREQFKDDLQCLFCYIQGKDLKPTINDKIALESIPIAQKNISVALNLGKVAPTIVCLPWMKAADEERVSSDAIIEAAKAGHIDKPVSTPMQRKTRIQGLKKAKSDKKKKTSSISKRFGNVKVDESFDTTVDRWSQNDDESVHWLWKN